MIHEILDEAQNEFDRIMQEKYKEFCISQIAKAKEKQERARKDLEFANTRYKEAGENLNKIKTDSKYMKELYYDKSHDPFHSTESKSQYRKDLDSLQK